MSEVDWVILAIIVISALVSFMRGFLKEAVSLVTWMSAIFITLMFTSRFASLLPSDTFESPTARYSISVVILFFGTMFIGGLINWLFHKAVGPTSLGPIDRLLGIAFGLARGALIVATIVLLSNLVPTMKQEVWWRESSLLPKFQLAAVFIHARLPTELAAYFDFSTAGA